jgi:hypothetical protein
MDVDKRAGWGVTIRRVSNHCRNRRKEKGSIMSRYRYRPIKRELVTALFLDADRQEVLKKEFEEFRSSGVQNRSQEALGVGRDVAGRAKISARTT